jgi:hypothetical protein
MAYSGYYSIYLGRLWKPQKASVRISNNLVEIQTSHLLKQACNINTKCITIKTLFNVCLGDKLLAP